MALGLGRRQGESIIFYKDGKEIGRITLTKVGIGNPRTKVELDLAFSKDVTIVRSELVK